MTTGRIDRRQLLARGRASLARTPVRPGLRGGRAGRGPGGPSCRPGSLVATRGPRLPSGGGGTGCPLIPDEVPPHEHEVHPASRVPGAVGRNGPIAVPGRRPGAAPRGGCEGGRGSGDGQGGGRPPSPAARRDRAGDGDRRVVGAGLVPRRPDRDPPDRRGGRERDPPGGGQV